MSETTARHVNLQDLTTLKFSHIHQKPKHIRFGAKIMLHNKSLTAVNIQAKIAGHVNLLF